MPSGEKTGKMTPERVAAFKAVMYTKPLVELHREFSEVGVDTLCKTRNGQIWADIEPEQTKRKF